MRRLSAIAALLALSIGPLGGTAYPCAVVRSSARLDAFSCGCTGAEGSVETQIYVVSGSIDLTNHMATPTLGSLVVELQAREGSVYLPVARQVLNAHGSTSVATCKGTFFPGPVFTAGSVDGRLVLVDANGNEVPFDAVKNLPEGLVTLNFIATFAGNIPEMDPGERARVKVYTTAKNAAGTQTCTVDADSDGFVDTSVVTLSFVTFLRVPTSSFVITP